MADNLPVTPPNTPPATLSRSALERILGRATELQAQAGEDDGGGLTEAQLLDLAKEVGLSADNVREALAEERSRVEEVPDSSAGLSLLGSATVQAARTVPGDVASVLAGLDQWMQGTESLQVMRRYPDQLTWEPRHDFLSSIRRTLRVGGRVFTLAVATDVHGVVAAAGGKRTHVRLVASFTTTRGQRATAAVAASVGGMMVGLPLWYMATNAGLSIAAAMALIPALGLPAAAFALVRGQYRRLLARAKVSLEQALDKLEYGDAQRRPASSFFTRSSRERESDSDADTLPQ